MKFKYKMPDLSETSSEFEILDWSVEEGEVVDEDAPLVEVATDKATVQVPSPVTGRLISKLVAKGDTITAGTPIAELETV